ncbi:MAG: YjgP/YjgQ family permease [Opitutus sp.]|nr:YjgP/YjgQ family permease [Opitutus sp.]
MNLLDRHIFKSVLFTCAAAVGLFTFVVALPNVVKDLLGPWLAGQLSTAAFLRLTGLLFPFAISFALPMGMLTGVLLTLGRLSADSEITAMRASGIAVVRVARPVFILAALCAIVALYINFDSMPRARVQFHRELAGAVRANPLRLIVPKTFIRDFRGYVIYVGAQVGPELRDIWLWELDDQKRVTRFVRAESGRLDYDEATNSLIPTLVHAMAEERNPNNPEDFSKSPKSASVEKTEEVRISLDRLFDRDAVQMKPEWLTYPELRADQRRLARKPAATREDVRQKAREQMKFELIVQEKFNLSLAVFSFALIGVPLGIKVSRRETSANLGIALVLVLGYYFLTVMVKWLDRHPEYRPDLLFWLPNMLFLALGIALLRRLDRH